MKVSDEELVLGTGNWLLGRSERPASGLSVDEAFDAAKKILEDPRAASHLRDADPDIQFAAIELLLSATAKTEDAVELAERFYSELRDRAVPQDEDVWLRQQIAFLGWNSARKAGRHTVSNRWFGELRRLIEWDEILTERLNRVAAGEDDEGLIDLILSSPLEILLLRDRLSQLLEATPRVIKVIAMEFHARLKEIQSDEPSELLTFLLGEFALVAGTACRQTSSHGPARDWLDQAERHFAETTSSSVSIARICYQRLAIDVSERRLESTFDQAAGLERAFRDEGLVHDALKIEFLVGLSLMECGNFDRAWSLFKRLANEAEAAEDIALLASAYANLVHISGLKGDLAGARELALVALPLLEARQNWIGVAKLHWGLGNLHRELGDFPLALVEYTTALSQLDRIGLEVDVASLHLLIAHLRFLMGADREALDSVRAALPLIERLELTPELLAALQLINDWAQKGRLDVSILRGLSRPRRS